jgi:biopolymer transport protein ExbB/biopolymer transport protein TolQ
MMFFVSSLLLSSFALIQQPENAVRQFSFAPMDMLRHMSWVGIGVVMVLLLMSIYSIAIMAERYLVYRAAARQSRAFAPRVAEKLRASRLEDALELSRTYRRSHLAVVLNSGLQELSAVRGDKLDRQMRKAKRALKRASAIKSADLHRGLSGLATIGSTAPFVGLFGTVIGIIDAFVAMNADQASGFSTVAGGISEALVTTAFGLLVAIPAVWMYNYFSNRVRVFEIEMSNSGDELIDFFLQQREAA